MPLVDYSFRCFRDRPEPEWTRVLSQASDVAAVLEARLLLQSQAALAPKGPITVEVGRGRVAPRLNWLGCWVWRDGLFTWTEGPDATHK